MYVNLYTASFSDLLAPAIPGPGHLAAPGTNLSPPAPGGQREWRIQQEIQETDRSFQTGDFFQFELLQTTIDAETPRIKKKVIHH